MKGAGALVVAELRGIRALGRLLRISSQLPHRLMHRNVVRPIVPGGATLRHGTNIPVNFKTSFLALETIEKLIRAPHAFRTNYELLKVSRGNP